MPWMAGERAARRKDAHAAVQKRNRDAQGETGSVTRTAFVPEQQGVARGVP